MISKYTLATLFIAATLFGCVHKKEKAKRNKMLLDFKYRVAMNVDEIIDAPKSLTDAINSEQFDNLTDTMRFGDNRIYLSYLLEVNGCTNYDGDIEYKGDSILLKMVNVSDTSCTEPRCDRIVFIINNPGNKKYKINKLMW